MLQILKAFTHVNRMLAARLLHSSHLGVTCQSFYRCIAACPSPLPLLRRLGVAVTVALPPHMAAEQAQHRYDGELGDAHMTPSIHPSISAALRSASSRGGLANVDSEPLPSA
jgi:hypothetical protein